VSVYSPPGAFTSSIFPREWSDRLDEFFSDVRLELMDGVGHYAPIIGRAD
jgi:hypothetical protein